MGTACICYKDQKKMGLLTPITASVFQPEKDNLPGSHAEGIKIFMDIQNHPGDEQPSELNLININQELARFLIAYETKNGTITHRFTQRVVEQQSNQDPMGHNEESLHANKENINSTRKANELYLPLTNQDADSAIDVDLSAYSQPDHEHSNSNKSCLLSLSSCILNESLFTERAEEKMKFYQYYNKLGEAVFQKWCDNNRLSFQFEPSDITKVKEKYFEPKYISCLNSIYQYWQNHFIHLLTYCLDPTGIKIYINGTTKMLPISQRTPSSLSLIDIYESFVAKIDYIDIADLTYLLTGWMPEHIYLSEIKNFAGILERLTTNLAEGNTLITFTRATMLGEEYATLLRIDLEAGLIFLKSISKKNTIHDVLLEYKNEASSEIGVKIQSFIELYDVINLNWNPYIYDVNQTCQGILNGQNKGKKFLLVIPSSSQDLQIRLFFQRHKDFVSDNKLGITINLYQYNGTCDISESQPIRTMETDEAIYSDVFIFQYCKDKTQYLLSVQAKESDYAQDVYFTLSLYSFAEMKFKELQEKPCLQSTKITTNITQENVGFGINSPYFNKNLQFSVEADIGGQLQIIIEASKKLTYEICLIPDPSKQKNLTKLKLQNIINNSQISGDKSGKGSFFIKTSFHYYLLMINSYSAANQSINVGLKFYGKRQMHNCNVGLKIEQIIQLHKPIFVQDVKWLPTHFGPRKRLKSNSNNEFQPMKVFADFFKNPIVDKKLVKGTYQFYIKSETFREYFDSVESYEDKNSCEPPALSMAILLNSQDKQSYKIIVDDAFYVPFGVGFWTTSIQLEEGNYRFVLPKMDKGFSKGTFGILKN